MPSPKMGNLFLRANVTSEDLAMFGAARDRMVERFGQAPAVIMLDSMLRCVSYVRVSQYVRRCISSGRDALNEGADDVRKQFNELGKVYETLPPDLVSVVFPAAQRHPLPPKSQDSKHPQLVSVLDTSSLERVKATICRVRETITGLLRERRISFVSSASVSELAAALSAHARY